MSCVYFDNAATMPVSKNVKDVICDAFDIYGNPSSQHNTGRVAKALLNQSRANIEKNLGLPNNSFVFTSGGTESDNMAIKMCVEYGLKHGRNKIITSTVEHHAILNTIKKLDNVIVEYIDVNKDGIIDIKKLESMVDYKTSLVSIMTSNNETGVIFDIYAIAELVHRKGGLFHTDAVQGITHMPIASALVDLYSISGHKFSAPKGIGGLYINPAIIEEIKPYSIITGGQQEFGLRASTENTPYIAGMSQAIDDLTKNRNNTNKTISELSSYFKEQLSIKFEYCKVNGINDNKFRNPSIINFSTGFADAASIVEWMSLNNICISSGSACNTGSTNPSHVLTAMGLTSKEAFSSVRVSLSQYNTKEEIDYFMDVFKSFESRYKI